MRRFQLCLCMLFFLGCESSEGTPGQETSPCSEGQCFEGLVCLSDVCVAPESSSTTGASGGVSPSSATTAPDPVTTSTSGKPQGETEDGSESGTSCADPPCETACPAALHTPCDAEPNDPFRAMGLECPGEPPAGGVSTGDPASIGVRQGFGGTDRWSPTEGSSFAVLSTGLVAELDEQTPAGDPNISPTYCNDDVPLSPDPGGGLPAPIDIMATSGDCVRNPGLVGTGDCSGSLSDQFSQGGAAFDYVELRSVLEVPEGVHSISYDFAFLSTEYPEYFGASFNDMFVGWLESELWTGNTAFDEQGNAISLNSGFLDFRDDEGSLPEFGGTCMRQHAATRWLRSSAPVLSSEQVTLVFAVFDLADPLLDTVVFLDNVSWGCEEIGRPTTVVAD